MFLHDLNILKYVYIAQVNYAFPVAHLRGKHFIRKAAKKTNKEYERSGKQEGIWRNGERIISHNY